MSNITKCPREVNQLAISAQKDGQVVGVVMTMGALHEGHLSLVRAAIEECDWVVVTIFVNPTQFGPDEDYDAYPRPLDRDVELLSQLNVDLIFAPETSAVYASDHSTMIQPPSIAEPLEGLHRQGHFQGVCTVVLKLLHITAADRAYFGQKDYQQYLVIRDMARDLNLQTEIIACPICRDPDGLAMSSRNAYLSDRERARALGVPEALTLAVQLISEGERRASTIETAMQECLIAAQLRLDYAVIRDVDRLQPIEMINSPVIAAIAAHVGSTRLIDNRLIDNNRLLNHGDSPIRN